MVVAVVGFAAIVPAGSGIATASAGARVGRDSVRARVMAPALATPGRVQQLPGQAGYAFDTDPTVSMSTTVTVPTLQCGEVPVADRSAQPGLQLSLEIGGQYVMVESFCATGSTGGFTQFNLLNALVSGTPYDPQGFLGTLPGTQIQLSESVSPTSLSATIASPSQGFTKTLVANGSFSGAFVGTIDFSESGNGGVPGYNSVPFASTDVNGSPIGAFLAAHPASAAVRQSSVWGPVMQDETSDAGSGDVFTVTNSNLTLPTVSVSTTKPAVARPTSGTATMVFDVTLSNAESVPAYVDYVTQDETAIAGSDYDATNGTLAFAAGATKRTVHVTILPGGPTSDPEIDFRLEVGNPSYAFVPTGTSGVGRILTGPAVTGVTPSASDVGRPGPTWTVSGSGFTGATAVGFYSGATRVFHLNASKFSVNPDGTEITTLPTQAAGIENIVHSALGDRSSYAFDVRVAVGDETSVATPADVITLAGPTLTRARPTAVDVSRHPGPVFTLTGSGFTGATSVGFYTGATRHFHLAANKLTVNAAGTRLTTTAVNPTAIAQILQEDLGDPPWVLDARVSTGAITSGSQTITFATEPAVTHVTPTESDVGQPGPTWTVSGSGFTGAMAVGFYSGATRVFHLNASKFSVNPDGTEITTLPTQAAGIENILHSALGDRSSYTFDVRIAVGGLVSAANAADEVTLDGPQLTSVSPTTVNLDHHPGPAFTLTGSGFTGATSVGFYTGTTRHFHLLANRLTVSADGTQITTTRIDPTATAQILQEDLGDSPWVLDVRVSTGAITGNAQTVTFTSSAARPAAGATRRFV